MTEWKDCSETPSASCSGILGRNQITHSLSRTLSSLAVQGAPFRLVGFARVTLRIRSSRQDRFPPRTVDSNCFCPAFKQFPLLRSRTHQVQDEYLREGKQVTLTPCRFQLLKSDRTKDSVLDSFFGRIECNPSRETSSFHVVFHSGLITIQEVE